MLSGSQFDVSADVVVHEIQEILLPRKKLPASLYFENMENEWQYLEPAGEEIAPLRLEPSEEISTNSYFNCCYLDYWRQLTSVRRIGVRICYGGTLQVRVVILGLNGQPSEVFEHELSGTAGSSDNTAVLWAYEENEQGSSQATASRMYVTATAQTKSEISAMTYVTDSPPVRDVSLSVGLCTFNREAHLVNTIAELLRIAKEENVIDNIIVVNHGSEIADPTLKHQLQDPMIKLINQRNLGGCGGFNRTMYEALYGQEPCTHHLLMDDDIVIDARVIRRAVAYLRYTTNDVVLGGQMLDASAPTSLFEAGARLDAFWHVVSLGRHLNLTDPQELDFFNTYQAVDYNGWWFCIMPTAGIREMEFSPPIFIHGDDMEYCCRFGRHGYPTIPLPGVAVWHEPFFLKNSDWQNFYDLRNRLVISTINNAQTQQPDALYILGFCMEFLLTHRYRAAEMCLAAVHDFLKGPDAVLGFDAEKKHAQVMKLARSIPQPDPTDQISPAEYKPGATTTRSTSIPKMALLYVGRFFALSLLPYSQKPTQIFRSEYLHPGVVGNTAYLLSDDIDGKEFLLFKLKRWRLWKGTARALGITLRYLLRRKSINRDWLSRIGHYQTKQSWEKIFFEDKPK